MLVEEERLLLGRRPDGKWCIPCGHVEWNEDVEAAAAREMVEETGLIVELLELLAVQSNFHDPERQTVGIWYRGQRTGGQLRAGSDLVEVALFELTDLPRLAFSTDMVAIENLMANGKRGPLHGVVSRRAVR